jgi:hypothetical protein
MAPDMKLLQLLLLTPTFYFPPGLSAFVAR